MGNRAWCAEMAAIHSAVQGTKIKLIICNYFQWNYVLVYIPGFTQRLHPFYFCTVPSSFMYCYEQVKVF